METKKSQGPNKRHRFRSRKQKRQDPHGRRPDDRDSQPAPIRVGSGYSNIVKENAAFDRFYKAQNIVASDEEWNEFKEALKHPLPSDFRISSHCAGQTEKMRELIQNLTTLSTPSVTTADGDEQKVDEKQVKTEFAVSQMPWYPNKLGWTINLSKIEIRKSTTLNKLHHFLISETETGDISRQEAVSMIPPLLLQVKPGHSVLDMCAAPGSKTAQVIEMLHADSNMDFILDRDGNPFQMSKEHKVLNGLVVANDVDNKRCYMLVHQSNRLHSPCVVITNHDASLMPNFYKTDHENRKSLFKFDRVLADVPCSGDGTLRKNYDVWTKWNAANSNNFHYLQLKIAKRGLELLAKDGLIAYSTCSLNPAEDEAVIAQLLKEAQGGLELLDAAKMLPELKSRPGLEHWTVMSRDAQEFSSYNEVPENLQSQIRESLFPPSNAAELNLKHCVRVLPHYQNTGGFFIAILHKKVDKMAWEAGNESNETKEPTSAANDENLKEKKTFRGREKRVFHGHKEDPFFFFNEEDPDWPVLKNYYSFPDNFNIRQVAHRCSKGKRRNLYFLTECAANFIASNDHVKLITGGCRVFNRVDVNNVRCNFRITQEGIPSLFPYFVSNLPKYMPAIGAQPEEVATRFNIMDLDAEHFVKVLRQEDVKMEQFSEAVRSRIESLSNGCCILYLKIARPEPNADSSFMLPICAWKGRNSIRAYVAKSEKIHLLRLCGVEPELADPSNKGPNSDANKPSNDDDDLDEVSTAEETNGQPELKKCKIEDN